jgi:DNA polymerase III subunit epsilon
VRYGLRTLSDRLLKSTGRDIGPIIDILVIDRALRWQPGWGNRKLHQLAAIYGVPTTTLHDSAEDTKLSMRIAWRMAAKYPLALDVPAQVLHDQQRTWHKSWASEFTAYLAPKGGGPISPVWPVVRYDPAVGGLVMNGSAPAGTLL